MITSMLIKISTNISAFLIFSWCSSIYADVTESVNWPQFLERSDPIWTTAPSNYWDAPFMGNGQMGTIFWQQGKQLQFEMSRADWSDHRNLSNSPLKSFPRLPNGRFLLDYVGKPTAARFRIDLWNAQTKGVIDTSKGSFAMRSFIHATEDVMVLEITTTGDERDFTWHWQYDVSETPRKNMKGFADSTPYPAQFQSTLNGVEVSVQQMPESSKYNTQGTGYGEMATAWKIIDVGNGKKVIYISEAHVYPGTVDQAKHQAVQSVNDAINTGLSALEQSHRQWWHNFYPKSFISFPESKLESFYWLQLYKMASATRGNSPTVIDLMGPWFYTGTGWPGTWWNLNVQATYGPFAPSNHGVLGGSLLQGLTTYKHNLALTAGGHGLAVGRATGSNLLDNVASKEEEPGNLAYALYLVWEQYRLTMDDAMLKEKLWPLMKGAYQYFKFNYIELGADGLYHLKMSTSPEYQAQTGVAPTKDATYSLAILKWILKAMLISKERLDLNDAIFNDGIFSVDKQGKLNKLAPYPKHVSEGFMIGSGQRFTSPHRHWSHMFMIYPFFEYTYDDAAQAPIIDQTIAQWIKPDDSPAYSSFRGYSWFAIASMRAMQGKGNLAREHLIETLSGTYGLKANTMYSEGAPVIESPLMGARSIQDMMLLSFNDVIRVFPAVPNVWADISLHKFRADGAFLISAQRKKGQTTFIRVESLAGEPLQINTGMAGIVKASGQREFIVTTTNGITTVDLKQDEWVILYTGASVPDLTIEAVKIIDSPNFWGAPLGSNKTMR